MTSDPLYTTPYNAPPQDRPGLSQAALEVILRDLAPKEGHIVLRGFQVPCKVREIFGCEVLGTMVFTRQDDAAGDGEPAWLRALGATRLPDCYESGGIFVYVTEPPA